MAGVKCIDCGAEISARDPRCPRCGASLPDALVPTREVSGTGDWPASLVDPLGVTVTFASAPPPPLPGAGESDTPAALGRFEVLGRLGKGAMGVVVHARDPRLGREVAIKVLRPEALGRAGTEQAHARLVREAQAMARLKHPNVVTVHEVDVVGEQVMVVMEHVAGRTLAAFCAERQRPPAELLAAFLEAGRGLAAVHQAGLVHRDFKPDNVLVGTDGRVRVTDFGLVGLSELPAHDEGASAGPLDLLTRSGALLGTPLYMAPEQHEGRPADARADQFAFCVALWEALAGERPFPGETYEQLKDSVVHGRLRRPPRRSGLSPRIRRILERGLSVDRQARYPDLDTLLAALSSDGGVTRRRAIGAAGVLGLAALALFGLARRPAAPLCQGGEAKLAGVWDGAVKARVSAAFSSTGRPYAGDTYRRAEKALDERARAWLAMYADSCEATQLRGEQSAELLDLRTQCLEQRRGDLGALTALFARGPDAEVLDHAVDAVSALPGLEGCSGGEALRAAVPLPVDRAARAAVESLRARLGEARALLASGKPAQATALALAAANEAEALAWIPLQAEAQATLGRAEADSDPRAAEPALRAAALLAGKARDDRLLAEVLIELVHVVGVRLGRYAEAHALETAALSAVERAGGDPLLHAPLLLELGRMLAQQREGAAAVEKSRAALALYEKAFGPDAPEVAVALETLGTALTRTDRHEEARGLLERALEVEGRALGPEHPRRAETLTNLGNALYRRGKVAESIARGREALALQEKVLGPDHLRVADTLGNLAVVLAGQGGYAEALALDERSLAIREKRLGPDHADVGLVLNNIAVIYDEQGKYAEAANYYARSLRVREKVFGPRHHEVALVLANLGDSLVRQGKTEEAVASLERAIAIYDERGEAEGEEMATALTFLGNGLLARRESPKAIAPLERALAIREAHAAERDPVDLATTRFTLARALWDAGRDRRRALSLAGAARDAFAAPGADDEKDLAETQTWLAAHQAR